MYEPKIKKYMKKLSYSYAMGTFPTIDLLKYKPGKVLKVLINSKGWADEEVKEVISLCNEKGIKYEVMDSAIGKIAVKENTYTVGIFEKYEMALDPEKNHVVLDSPTNMGNIGTIIRTMNGFGINDLALIKPAADIFNPTIVRSAMGSLFQTRFMYFDSFEKYCEMYKEHSKYLLMLKGAKEIEKVQFKKPYSLVMGNESSGLPDEYAKLGETVCIPHLKTIDSLNLSIATAIAIYVSSKQ
jgi:TrmH family RNA methyltransferase